MRGPRLPSAYQVVIIELVIVWRPRRTGNKGQILRYTGRINRQTRGAPTRRRALLDGRFARAQKYLRDGADGSAGCHETNCGGTSSGSQCVDILCAACGMGQTTATVTRVEMNPN